MLLPSPTAWGRTGPPLQSPLSFYFLGQPEEVQGTWHPSKPDLSQATGRLEQLAWGCELRAQAAAGLQACEGLGWGSGQGGEEEGRRSWEERGGARKATAVRGPFLEGEKMERERAGRASGDTSSKRCSEGKEGPWRCCWCWSGGGPHGRRRPPQEGALRRSPGMR